VTERMKYLLAPQNIASITKVFTFNSAHSLPNYPGHCKNVHGHTYRLEVTIRGPVNTETGMVMDFYDLKSLVKEHIIKKLDHCYLNDVLPYIPTAENIAIWICRSLQNKVPTLYKIKLWETPTSCVEVYVTDVQTSSM